MSNKEKIKVMLVSSDHAVFRFFSNLFIGEPIDLLRCINPADSQKSVGMLKPSVVLLHIDNPNELPLIKLSNLLIKFSVPTVLVSRNPDAIPDVTSKGLKMGALELVSIPSSYRDISPDQSKRLIRTISNCAGTRLAHLSYKDIVSAMHDKSYSTPGLPGADTGKIELATSANIDVIGLAISTGGPSALSRFIPSLPESFPPPVLVVQHIIPGFLENVAARLNNSCAVNVKIAEHQEPLASGTVYFAPDGKHLKVARSGESLISILDEEPSNVLFRPCADVLLQSMAEVCGPRCMGVIMTGMGKDGVEGLRSLKKAGAITMAQDQQSSAIYGMARIAVDENLVDHIVPLTSLAGEISKIVFGSGKNNPA